MSSMLDEIESKTLHKDKKVIYRGKRSKTLNEVKPVENIRPCVVDLLFIVTCAFQKIKVYFCCINIDYTKNFEKKCFSFYLFPFEYKKRQEKYTLNSIMLQNLL